MSLLKSCLNRRLNEKFLRVPLAACPPHLQVGYITIWGATIWGCHNPTRFTQACLQWGGNVWGRVAIEVLLGVQEGFPPTRRSLFPTINLKDRKSTR